MSKIRTLCFISGLVAALSIAPVFEFAALNLSPSSASAQFYFTFWRREPPVPLGTRSGVCPMTPGLLDKDATVMSDRPLFAWQGEAVKLTVIDSQTQAEVWSTDLDPNLRQIEYQGKTPLEPNRLYQWQILGKAPTSTDRQFWGFLTVMAPAQRAQHLAKFKEIEQKSKSAEAIADEKVSYLLDPSRQLWSDAVQVLISVKNPSPDFANSRQEFIANLCTKTTANKAK